MVDAHVHIGWYARRKTRLWYYSPRRVIGILNRCGVDGFIVSSTTSQAVGATVDGLISESEEIERIAGSRARIFLWVSWQHYVKDPMLSVLDCGLFSGIKLHEHEGHWVEQRQTALLSVLAKAEELKLPVQFHADHSQFCSPQTLARIAAKFPLIHFDFAHCNPMGTMASVIADYANVWTDTAYMELEEFAQLRAYNWHDRLMFGTDLPVWQSHEDVGLTRKYRAMKRAFEATGLSKSANVAFQKFVK